MGKWVGSRCGQMVSNSSVVNFVPESRLPFVQISFIYRKTAAEAWNWCQRWLGLKYFIRKKKKTNKQDNLFLMFRCSRKFSVRMSQKVVFHLLSNRIFRKLVGFAFRLFSLACFAAMQISSNKRIIFLYIRSPHSFLHSKGLFTWRWGTPGRWGNPLRWGNPPVHVTSHFSSLLSTFTW